MKHWCHRAVCAKKMHPGARHTAVYDTSGLAMLCNRLDTEMQYLSSKANKLGLRATKHLLKSFAVVWLPTQPQAQSSAAA